MDTSGRRDRFLSVAVVTLLLLFSGLLLPHGVGAWPQYLDNLDDPSNGFIGKYPTWPYKSQPTGCLTCHTTFPPTAQFNPYGNAFKAAKQGPNVQAALAAIAGQDSDGDGVPNEAEILFGTFPGDSKSKPVTPGGVKASDATFEDKVQVAWNPYTNATFQLHRATDSPDGAKAQIASTSNTQFADTTAVAGKTYYYWIKACHGAWCTDFSAPDAGTKKVAADQPSQPGSIRRGPVTSLAVPIPGSARLVAPKATMGIISLSVSQNTPQTKTASKSYDPPQQGAMVEMGYYTATGGNTRVTVKFKNTGKAKSSPMTAGGTVTASSRFLGLDLRTVPALAPGETHEIQWDAGLFPQGALAATVHLK